MTTRRSMVWLFLFLLTLPTVAAAADTVQRASAGDVLVRMGPVHEGERFVYDLHFSSLLNGINTTLEDWYTVEIGAVEERTFLDGSKDTVFPTTFGHGFAPWMEEHGTRIERERETVTQYLRPEDGVYVAREGKYLRETWEETEDGVAFDRSDRIITRMGDGLGGSFYARGLYPESGYSNGNVVTRMVMAFFEPYVGQIYESGTWNGREVHQVERRAWSQLIDGGSFRCDTQHPEFSYNDWEDRERFGPLTEAQTVETWIEPGLALPVLATCHSRYLSGDAVVEEIELRLELASHDKGGAAIQVGWDPYLDRESPRPAPIGTPEPVALPGVPPEGGLGLRLPLADVMEALRQSDDPDIASFRSDGDVPFMLMDGYHTPYVPLGPSSSSSSPGEDLLPPIPLGDQEAPAERATSLSSWRLVLQNVEGDVIQVTYDRAFDDEGEQRGEDEIRVSQDQLEGVVGADDFPAAMVPMGDLFDAWVGLDGADRAAWHTDPEARIDIRNPFWFEGNVVEQSRHEISFQRDDPERATSAEQGYAHRMTHFDLVDGSVQDQYRDVRESREGGSPPRDFAPASATEPITVQQYVPAAATASSIAVVAAFAAAYFWDGLTRVLAQGVLAPLYAKIRKEKVLDHKTRDQIVEYVRLNPGAPLGAVRLHMEVGYGTVVHHLNTLERNGILTSRKVGRSRCYFLKGVASPGDMDAQAAASMDAAARFLEVVAASPGITQREVAVSLGVRDSSVRYQAKRLIGVGQVKAVRDGRVVRYFPAKGGPLASSGVAGAEVRVSDPAEA